MLKNSCFKLKYIFYRMVNILDLVLFNTNILFYVSMYSKTIIFRSNSFLHPNPKIKNLHYQILYENLYN